MLLIEAEPRQKLRSHDIAAHARRQGSVWALPGSRNDLVYANLGILG
jgi:hypothetical protein